jgi:acyl carrier protein
MTSIADIEKAVLSDIQTLVPRGTKITLDMRLIADLKLASDDATALLIDIERKFNLRIPRQEWAVVSTVQGTINLLAAHVIHGTD